MQPSRDHLHNVNRIVSHAWTGEEKEAKRSWVQEKKQTLQTWSKQNSRLILWGFVTVNVCVFIFSIAALAYCARLAYLLDLERKNSAVAYSGFTDLLVFTKKIETALPKDEKKELQRLLTKFAEKKLFQQMEPRKKP